MNLHRLGVEFLTSALEFTERMNLKETRVIAGNDLTMNIKYSMT